MTLNNTPACTCSFTVNAARRYDPTRTLTLRDRFARDMKRRVNGLRKDIVESVGKNDAFGLTVNAAAFENQFAYTRNADKIEAFLQYLKELEELYLLSGGTAGVSIRLIPGRAGAVDQSWMNTYLQSAYQRGILRSRRELRRLGVDIGENGTSEDQLRLAFNQPFHADAVGLIYTRAYNELKGITAAMDQQISRLLAEDLLAGRHPREIAARLNTLISGSGDTLAITDSLGRFIPAARRAEMLARTEIIRAHHLANIQEYRNAGILGVRVLAEFSTANDAKVCPQCRPLEGRIYTLDEAEFLIPVHPNCRCIIIPVLRNVS